MTAPKAILPLVFGSPTRRLFGIYYHPQNDAPPTRPAVVLCNAFGQEAIRASRFQRTLAERLSRAGHPVLRFDYFGTGDSMGDDADGDLEGWTQDVRTAHDELCKLTNTPQVVWVGMRLGATIAQMSARAAPAELIRLILWDPVLDGTRYLTSLRERHVTSLENVYSLPLRPPARKRAEDPTCFRDEAIGFAISPVLRKQLGNLDLRKQGWPATPYDLVVVMDPDSVDGQDIAAVGTNSSRPVATLQVKHGTNWTTDTAANTSLVPTAALMMLAQQAGVST
jgi:uncharacterized protein